MSPSEFLAGTEFPPADHAAWLALAHRSLKGAGDEVLTARTDDGLAVEALYPRAADRPAWGRGKARWCAMQRIDDPDPARANAQALEDVENGADGIALVFEGAPNAFGYGLPTDRETLGRVLEALPLHRVALRIDTHPGNRTTTERLLAYLVASRADVSKLQLSFGLDPAAVLAGTGRLRMSIEALEESMPPSLAHFFTLGVPAVLLEADGRVFHNAGATEAQELGAMLATAVSYLRLFEKARQPLLYSVPHIGFCLSVDQDQLLGLAKLRAARALWARVLESCAVPASVLTIHAETSWRMIAAGDFETNIVRNTIACFTAAAGGADSIAVLPHTIAHGLPDPFARRLARNTQAILADEAHIGKVADPARGSGAVEALTASLCEAAWGEFRRIEGEGGILRSLVAGKLQERVLEARDARAARFGEGARAIVGTTLYPPREERHADTLPAERRPIPSDGAVFCQRLEPIRLDQTLDPAT